MNSYVRYIAHCVDVIRCSTSILLCPWWFLGGCTRLLLYFNTNKRHSFFFLQNTSCIRKPQVTSGGGGAHPLHPPPRSAPANGAKQPKSASETSRIHPGYLSAIKLRSCPILSPLPPPRSLVTRGTQRQFPPKYILAVNTFWAIQSILNFRFLKLH